MSKCDGKTIAQRCAERYAVDPVSGCWNWTAGINGKGYGYIWTGPKQKGDTRQAYKVIWELKNGPVPHGCDLHHKCTNTACVNPDHLELLTKREHLRIGNSIVGINAQKTHCLNGHEFTFENTRINKNGARVCRTCARESVREIRKAKLCRAGA